jgi:WhiB family redox-sensing transcriptional regulator
VRTDTLAAVLSWPSWAENAACRGLAGGETDWWHPGDRRGTEARVAYAVARRVCQTCPVRLECCKYGLALLPLMGVAGMFGGLTPPELKELAADLERPKRVQAQHGTRAMYVGCHSRPGCRCGPCRQANAEGEYGRRRRDGERILQDCAGGDFRPCRAKALPGLRYCSVHEPREGVA